MPPAKTFIPPVVRPDTTSRRILLESRGSEGTRAFISWKGRRNIHTNKMIHHSVQHIFNCAFEFLHLSLRPISCWKCVPPPLSAAGSAVHLHPCCQLNLQVQNVRRSSHAASGPKLFVNTPITSFNTLQAPV